MNTKTALFIGADGGGTKTAFSCVDTYGNEIYTTTGGAMNYNTAGVAAAAKNFNAALGEIAENTPEYYIAGMGIGDPSTDDLYPMPQTDGFVSALRSGGALPRDAEIHIKSDAYMALRSVAGDEPGVLVISGTGCMGIACDKNGKIYIAGGWGQKLNADEGGGYYIAFRGISAALRSFDKIGENTLLCGAVKEYFGIDEARALIPLVYGETENLPPVAGFAGNVALCAEAGDKTAEDILSDTARILSGYALSLAGASNPGGESGIIGIYGGVFENNRYIRDLFRENVRKVLPKADIRLPQISPQKAAALYAAHKYNNIKKPIDRRV